MYVCMYVCVCGPWGQAAGVWWIQKLVINQHDEILVSKQLPRPWQTARLYVVIATNELDGAESKNLLHTKGCSKKRGCSIKKHTWWFKSEQSGSLAGSCLAVKGVGLSSNQLVKCVCGGGGDHQSTVH